MDSQIQWQELGKAKLRSINDSIPSEWKVEPIPSTQQQRDVTGNFICQYLSKEEVEITEATAPGIVQKTSSGEWTAEAVVRAFCHRASLAHQMVRLSIGLEDCKYTNKTPDQLSPRNVLQCRS